MDYCKLGEVYDIALAHNKKYPNNNSAYHIMTRITEEVGELAEQVNHFEDPALKNRNMESLTRITWLRRCGMSLNAFISFASIMA